MRDVTRTLGPLIAMSLLLTAIPASAGGFGRVGEETFRCAVTVGGGQTPAPAPNLGVDTKTLDLGPQAPEAAAGGCQLRGELVDSGTVVGFEGPDGCSGYAQDGPATPTGQTALEPGMTVEEGRALWAYCDPGVVQSEVALTIDFGGGDR